MDAQERADQLRTIAHIVEDMAHPSVESRKYVAHHIGKGVDDMLAYAEGMNENLKTVRSLLYDLEDVWDKLHTAMQMVKDSGNNLFDVICDTIGYSPCNLLDHDREE